MTHLQVVAVVALVFYAAWNVAFYAEGHRPRGSAGLKTLGVFGEVAIWTVLVWVAFFS